MLTGIARRNSNKYKEVLQAEIATAIMLGCWYLDSNNNVGNTIIVHNIRQSAVTVPRYYKKKASLRDTKILTWNVFITIILILILILCRV